MSTINPTLATHQQTLARLLPDNSAFRAWIATQPAERDFAENTPNTPIEAWLNDTSPHFLHSADADGNLDVVSCHYQRDIELYVETPDWARSVDSLYAVLVGQGRVTVADLRAALDAAESPEH